MQKPYSLLLLLLFCFANVTNNTIQQYKMQEKVRKNVEKNRLCATSMHIYATLRALYHPAPSPPHKLCAGFVCHILKFCRIFAAFMSKID